MAFGLSGERASVILFFLFSFFEFFYFFASCAFFFLSLSLFCRIDLDLLLCK